MSNIRIYNTNVVFTLRDHRDIVSKYLSEAAKCNTVYIDRSFDTERIEFDSGNIISVIKKNNIILNNLKFKDIQISPFSFKERSRSMGFYQVFKDLASDEFILENLSGLSIQVEFRSEKDLIHRNIRDNFDIKNCEVNFYGYKDGISMLNVCFPTSYLTANGLKKCYFLLLDILIFIDGYYSALSFFI